MTTPPSEPGPPLPAGARLGLFVGYHGWLAGFVVLAASQGRMKLAGEALLLGVPLSTALALATLRIVEGSADRTSMGRRLGGALFLGVGVLLLAINHWLAPRIAGDEGLRRAMEKLGGTYATSDWVAAACLAVSVVLLARK